MDIGDNIIDSRDVEREISELRTMLCDTPFGSEDDSAHLKELYEKTPVEWHDHFNTDDVEKLINLLSFKEQGETATSEWNYGETFILDDYFEKYAKEYLDDIGGVPENLEAYIDYDKFASDLQSDYSCIEVDGNTYWVIS